MAGKLKYSSGIGAHGCYFSIEPFHSEYCANLITPIERKTTYWSTPDEAKNWVDKQITRYQQILTYYYTLDR